MPNVFQQLVQVRLAAQTKSKWCRRAVCKRARRCLPPRDKDSDGVLFRCPYDSYEAWLERWQLVLDDIERVLRPNPLIRARVQKLREDARKAEEGASTRDRR